MVRRRSHLLALNGKGFILTMGILATMDIYFRLVLNFFLIFLSAVLTADEETDFVYTSYGQRMKS